MTNRRLWILVSLIFYLGCSNINHTLDIMPKGKAISQKKASEICLKNNNSIHFNGKVDTDCDFPILPMQIFALQYDMDFVVETQHEKWVTHEFSLLKTPEGPLWFMQDAYNNKGNDMFVTASENGPYAHDMLNYPELPAKLK